MGSNVSRRDVLFLLLSKRIDQFIGRFSFSFSFLGPGRFKSKLYCNFLNNLYVWYNIHIVADKLKCLYKLFFFYHRKFQDLAFKCKDGIVFTSSAIVATRNEIFERIFYRTKPSDLILNHYNTEVSLTNNHKICKVIHLNNYNETIVKKFILYIFSGMNFIVNFDDFFFFFLSFSLL